LKLYFENIFDFLPALVAASIAAAAWFLTSGVQIAGYNF
jgi:hypothetical protein